LPSPNKRVLERVKAFGMTNQMLLSDLDDISAKLSIDLGHRPEVEEAAEEPFYYLQFDESVRHEAALMAKHYRLFYCLEQSIRSLIAETLEEAEGSKWWDGECVPADLRKEVQTRMKREIESGISRRSDDQLDYTNFGELSVIISANWQLFGSVLDDPKAVTRVLTSLNTLRAPIAHCSPLAEDEQLRLRIAVRDWFRRME
jgi:hypothetical protein